MFIPKEFRKSFLNAKFPLRIVGAHDGLGAKLIEKHGFDGVWASGLEISASYGVPDINLLSMHQCLERAIEMRLSTHLPIIADIETGYGDINNAQYTVRQYESAGIDAVVIEDKIFPKRNSFLSVSHDLLPLSDFCTKLKAIKAACKQKNGILIIARIEALIAGLSMEEAVKRAEAYVSAGADGILIHSKSKTSKEIHEFLKRWQKLAPIVLVPTTYPSITYQEMSDLGVNLVIYANQGLRASVRAVNRVLKKIKDDKSTLNVEDSISSMQEIFELQQTDFLSYKV